MELYAIKCADGSEDRSARFFVSLGEVARLEVRKALVVAAYLLMVIKPA